VGRTIADPSMPVSGRLAHVGSATLAGQLSEETFSRFPIRVLKMRSYAEQSVYSEVRLVPKAARELIRAGVDPIKQELAERVNSGTKPGDLAERLNSGTNLGDLAENVNSGVNLKDLAEKVNSGVNPGDLAERVNSGTNLGDLAEMVNLGTNPGDLAEKLNSGTNPGDLAEKVNSGTNPGDLTEKVKLSTNLGDLAKKVNSGTNPVDLAERVGMTSSDSSSSVRVISSLESGGVSQGDPEASSSGASSGPPSLVDARVLRYLEVMKADHDLDTAVTEGSLVVIRGRYSIPAEYGLHVPWPG
ncbi:hypothetical protein B296_00057634, partial [Ensete ventricosum]